MRSPETEVRRHSSLKRTTRKLRREKDWGESFDGLKNPALAKFLSNQENADVSHDDIDALTELEDHLGAFAAGAVSRDGAERRRGDDRGRRAHGRTRAP